MDAKMYNRINDVLNQLLDDNKEKLSTESIELLAFLFSSPEGKAFFNEWLNQQKGVGGFDNIDYDRIYLKVQHHIDANQKKPAVHPFSVTRLLQHAAAILFLPLLGYSGYLMYQNVAVKDQFLNMKATVIPSQQVLEYISPAGARLRVVLPDSTEVWLNGNSQLSLSNDFGVKDRGVALRGQAFFHVKRNERSPFIVKTGSINIKALGTEFNVFAYPEESCVEAVLVSGKVAVNKEAKGLFVPTNEITLKPNQKVSFHKESETIDVKEVYSEPYQSWTKGKLIFNDDSMENVANVLEHYFNVKIIIDDPQILSYRFSATIEDSSIEQIMEYIRYSSPVKYTIKKNLITLKKN